MVDVTGVSTTGICGGELPEASVGKKVGSSLSDVGTAVDVTGVSATGICGGAFHSEDARVGPDVCGRSGLA